MLYSIIPPILIVLSLAAIIIFLAKKAKKVMLIKDQEQTEASDKKERNGWKFRQKLLVILERATRRSKIIFLKLENLFTGWSESIRKRRKKAEEKDGYQSEENEEIRLERRKNYASVLRGSVSEDVKTDNSKIEQVFIREKKIVKPMISEKVATPGNSETKKDLFEKILIERIAVNPKDVEAYERLGDYYIEIENWGYAKECFKQVIKLNSRNNGAKIKMRKLERLLNQ